MLNRVFRYRNQGTGCLAAEGLLVEHVFSKAWPDALQVGNVVRQLLDGFHLFLQVVSLDEVGQLQE